MEWQSPIPSPRMSTQIEYLAIVLSQYLRWRHCEHTDWTANVCTTFLTLSFWQNWRTTVQALKLVSRVPQRERERESERNEVFIRRCIRSELCSVNTKASAAMCDVSDNVGCSTVSCHTHIIPSRNYFRQSQQLQKTTISDHTNTVDSSQNVLRDCLMLTSFTELYSDIY